ncbi:hypothetical protein DSO57_1024198 [Entomophthora muscae]|uniref:Uncharacterized protein n=1 Tax=Entomophthora muscae TaxID=34485 RepID=A0ACC2SFF0_9FUNG|nr:hypothetical protein DSO57_1024198 [Entomophthora muscae]
MSSVLPSSNKEKELIMVPEGILMAHSMAAHNFPKFSGSNVKWCISQYDKFFKEYLVCRSDMVFNVCQFLAKKPAKWYDMVLEFDNWDE